jgi:hypothetical protein
VLNEQIGRNADNVPVRYTATGNFHYLIRASQSSAPQMCTGTLSIGGRLGLPVRLVPVSGEDAPKGK